MKDYNNLTRDEMANLTRKEMANLTDNQMGKIHTDILCALAHKFDDSKGGEEDIRLFCQNDENYAPNYNDYNYGNDYFKKEWIDDEFDSQ